MLQNIHNGNVKLNINIIVAYCKTKGIGINNTLPWKIKTDMLKFKELTIGNSNNAVIMGKNTWESIPNKPLKSRNNLILSNTLSFDYRVLDEKLNKEYINKTFTSVNNLINYCISASYETIWVIGGSSIYNSFLDNNLVDKLYITYLDYEFNCDTFFPEFDLKKYKLVEETIHNIGEDKSVNNKLLNNKLLNNKFNIYNHVYEKIDYLSK